MPNGAEKNFQGKGMSQQRAIDAYYQRRVRAGLLPRSSYPTYWWEHKAPRGRSRQQQLLNMARLARDPDLEKFHALAYAAKRSKDPAAWAKVPFKYQRQVYNYLKGIKVDKWGENSDRLHAASNPSLHPMYWWERRPPAGRTRPQVMANLVRLAKDHNFTQVQAFANAVGRSGRDPKEWNRVPPKYKKQVIQRLRGRNWEHNWTGDLHRKAR